MNFSHDPFLNDIATKVERGQRLTFDEGLKLYATDDLAALAKLADTVRRRMHGRTTYFNVNRHFNATNVCYAACKFCSFYRTPREADAYTQHIQDSLKIAGKASTKAATQIQ